MENEHPLKPFVTPKQRKTLLKLMDTEDHIREFCLNINTALDMYKLRFKAIVESTKVDTISDAKKKMLINSMESFENTMKDMVFLKFDFNKALKKAEKLMLNMESKKRTDNIGVDNEFETIEKANTVIISLMPEYRQYHLKLNNILLDSEKLIDVVVN